MYCFANTEHTDIEGESQLHSITLVLRIADAIKKTTLKVGGQWYQKWTETSTSRRFGDSVSYWNASQSETARVWRRRVTACTIGVGHPSEVSNMDEHLPRLLQEYHANFKRLASFMQADIVAFDHNETLVSCFLSLALQ